MKTLLCSSALVLLLSSSLAACSSDEDSGGSGGGDNGTGGAAEGGAGGDPVEAPAIDIPEFESELDNTKLLSDLTDEEIKGACEELVLTTEGADTEVACRIAAAGENDDASGCVDQVKSCLDDPDDALSKTTIRSTPEPIDCSAFDAQLADGCDFPVSLLEVCVNAMAASVVPSAELASCDSAGDYEDIEAIESKAKLEVDAGFVTICADLLACEDLVGALLGT